MLLNYKEYVTKLFNILTFNKLNFDNIIRNIMVYNYKFYNIIISICLLFFIIFKLCLIFFIFNLYFKSLDYIIDYMVLNNIIIFKEDTKSVIFSSLNFLINSTLENILFGLGVNNIIIIFFFLLNIILYYKNKWNNYIFIISLFLYLICMFINFYYLLELNNNIINYINDYIDLHITF